MFVFQIRIRRKPINNRTLKAACIFTALEHEFALYPNIYNNLPLLTASCKFLTLNLGSYILCDNRLTHGVR